MASSDALSTPKARNLLLAFNIFLVLISVGFIAYRLANGIPLGDSVLILILALGLFLNHLVLQYGKDQKAFNIVAYAYTAFMAVAIIWATIGI